jgi:hypothetical protein
MAGAAAQCYRRAGLRDICRTPSIANRLVVVVVGEAVSEAKSDTTRLVLGVSRSALSNSKMRHRARATPAARTADRRREYGMRSVQ